MEIGKAFMDELEKLGFAPVVASAARFVGANLLSGAASSAVDRLTMPKPKKPIVPQTQVAPNQLPMQPMR